MYLAPGTQLGPYEITSLLGAGGMGEVYKAQDSRLGRFVAVKVLLERDVVDADQRRRFAQEARAASALNHPGIVTVYDIGSQGGVDYIAMELVEGKTLEALLPQSGFALQSLLRYSVQAADALAKAHSASILHRDLKPSNMIVTSEGQVKVLDFGLAKLVQTSAGGEDQATGSLAAITEEGRLIGTAAYMSPEQAEGKVLDSRSDIFSFGAVLYEMATGQRAFRGSSPISTIMCILRDEPTPMSQIRREIPPEFERLIRRCLMKDPSQRMQSMTELRSALEQLREKSDAGSLRSASFIQRRNAPALWVGAAAVACGLLAFAAVRLLPSRTSGGPVSRPVPLTNYEGDERQPDFSPNGGQVAFSWNGEKQDNWDIYLKVVGSSAAPLRLTTDPGSDSEPKWSPDGRAIGFVRSTGDGDAIILTSALGGAERTLAAFPTAIDAGLSWSPDGKWLAISAGDKKGATGLRLVSAETGESRVLTAPAGRSGGDFQPAFAPNGRSLAFVRERGMNIEDLWILPLTRTYEAEGEPRRRLGDGKKNQGPAWSADGHDLVFSVGEAALAGMYRIAAEGSDPPVRIDALGDGVMEPAVSRTGDRLAFAHTFRTATVWRLDLANRGRPPEQLIASSSFRNAFPQYSPDGKRIAFFSNRTGSNQIWTCNADGTSPVQLTSMPGTTTGTPRWSPDGRWISFDSNSGGYWQVYVVDANGGKPVAVTDGEHINVVASWSRDGRWIYFTSRRDGGEEVWKIAAPAAKTSVMGTPVATQVTDHGGTSSLESADGSELYFTKTTANFAFSLWRKRLNDGDETEVLRSLHRYNFAVTDKSIFYTTPSRADSPAEVRELHLASGKVTTVHTLSKRIDLGLSVSPDGRYLLYTQLDSSGSDLMTVDGFR